MFKKFLIGTFAIAALAFAMTASAAYDFGTTTLKVGSKGPAVVAVQTVVGATADGSFGPMTKAKVMVWQKANGLTADGLFGNKSKAIANGSTVVTTTTTTTCPAGMTCTPVVTAVACPAGYTCTSNTGATTGALTGGAGDINLSSTSTDVETTVAEGASNTKVLGFKVEASGSDVSLTNLKVTLKNTDSSTAYQLNKYATTVSVYENGTKVGSADVADFTKDGQQYSKSIALTNAVVREGTNNKQTFYITISANDTIDSANFDSNWAVRADNIRFQDATGVVMTDGSSVGSTEDANGLLNAGKFDFGTLASSGDIKVNLSKDSSSPDVQNVQVSDTGSTKNVLMLTFKVKATSSDISFDTVNITPTAGISSIQNIVGELQLRNGSDELATIDGSNLATGVSVPFNLDSTFTVNADTTETFSVYATINSEKNFLNGGNLAISIAHSDFSPEDANGDLVIGNNYSGTAIGAVQTFLLAGASVQYVSDSYTAAVSGTTNPSQGSLSMTFKVTAFGDNDVLISDTGADLYNGTTVPSHTQVTVSTTGGSSWTTASISSSDLTASNHIFTVSAGSTETFTLIKKFDYASGFTSFAITNVAGSAVSSNITTATH